MFNSDISGDFTFFLEKRPFSWRDKLAEHLSLPLSKLDIRRNEHGKPYLKNIPLFFNVSHSQDWMIIALSKTHEIGIDMEYLKTTKYTPSAIVQRFFTPQEITEFADIPIENQHEMFVKVWCKKEAAAKCLGIPVIPMLKTCHIGFIPSDAPVHLLDEDVVVSDLLGLPQGYVGAIAVKRASVNS